MKLIRAAKIMFVITLAVMLAGCFDASYYFNFADEQATSNSEGAWLLQGEGVTGFSDFGLYDGGVFLTAPLEFGGDFTVTANFWLGVTAEYPGYFKFALSDLPFDGNPGNWVDIGFIFLATEDETLRITDSNGTDVATHENTPGEITSLNKTHWNRIEIKKKGDRITLILNGRRQSVFDITYCTADYYCISMVAGTDAVVEPTEPSLGFIIKDVKVEYMEGQAIPLI